LQVGVIREWLRRAAMKGDCYREGEEVRAAARMPADGGVRFAAAQKSENRREI